MKTQILSTALTLVFAGSAFTTVHADSFGTSGNEFTVDFVEVGNAGNANDPITPGGHVDSVFLPAGAVSYTYRLGKFEISQDAIAKAIAGGLANVTSGAWVGNQPAGNVSWYEAAAFVNWLNTSTGHQAAYNLTWTGTAWTLGLWSSADAWQAGGENRYRHKNAYYFLPSENEWYKAAYHKNDGVTANYWTYATASDTAPTPVLSGTSAGTAVYNGLSAPANVDQAGGQSAYGTVGQNGNVWEWTESADDGINSDPIEYRAIRGGSYQILSSEPLLRSDWGGYEDPNDIDYIVGLPWVGFRVASIASNGTVTIDIKPGESPNSINLKSKGVIPVAILTTDTFDATTVDPLSVRFGPSGAREAHGRGHIEDVNGDTRLDLVLHFRTQETGIVAGSTSASLTGQTFGGRPIVGTDSIRTVGN